MMDFKKESMQETGMSRFVAKHSKEEQLVLGQSGGGMSFETKMNTLNVLSENMECTEPKNEV